MRFRKWIKQHIFPGETPDPTPVAIADTEEPLSLRDEMRRFIREEISRTAAQDEFETFEESDDFEIEDDGPDLATQYTVLELVPDIGLQSDDLEGEEPATAVEESPTTDAGSSHESPPPSLVDKNQPEGSAQESPGEAVDVGTRKAIG